MSSLIEHIENGTALDRIRATYYDRKLSVHLSEKDKAYAEKLSQISEWWLEFKSDIATERMIMDKYEGTDRRRAWEWLQDAKTLYAIGRKFDPIVELAIQKLWIERTFELSETEKDPKMRKAALDANERYIEMQIKLAEKNKQVAFNVFITLHMDYREFMSEEQYAEAKAELGEIKQRAHKKFKGYEDAEFIEE